ncbi:MAG: hypothetical protein ABSA43_00950 [Candidatus Microgenomates bacterium]|jgi:hypothetical protein
MKELRSEISRRDLQEAEKYGGLDYRTDYLTIETSYCDKPDHMARSKANDQGQHEKHFTSTHTQ